MMFGNRRARRSHATRSPCVDSQGTCNRTTQLPIATTPGIVTGSAAVNGSGRATLVAMVQAADLWEGDNVAGRGRLHRPGLGAIFVDREMRAASVVVLKGCRQHTAEVVLIEDDDVVETFAADRANDAFDIGVLPRRSRRGDDLFDGHRLNTIAEGPTI